MWLIGYADVVRHLIPMSWNTTLSPLRSEVALGGNSGGHFCLRIPSDWNFSTALGRGHGGCGQRRGVRKLALTPTHRGELEVSHRITRRMTRPVARGLSGLNGVQFDGATEHVEIFGVSDSGLNHRSAHDVRGPQRRFGAADRMLDANRRFDDSS